MMRHAFCMKLHNGREAEYERRHDEIWSELVDVLCDVGVSDYTIWLEPRSGYLFALMHLREGHRLDELPKNPIVQRWWRFMADIMDTNADSSPVVHELSQVFHID